MRLRPLIPVVLLASALSLTACAGEDDDQADAASAPSGRTTSEPAPSPATGSTEPPAPAATPTSRETYASLSVRRTSRLTGVAADSFGEALRRDGDVRGVARARAVFARVEHHPVAYLAGITFNARGTGYSFCIGSRNGKARATVAGGTGPVAELTDRDCGGTADTVLVRATRSR